MRTTHMIIGALSYFLGWAAEPASVGHTGAVDQRWALDWCFSDQNWEKISLDT